MPANTAQRYRESAEHPERIPRVERLAITVADDDELRDEGEPIFEAAAGTVDVPSKATPTD